MQPRVWKDSVADGTMRLLGSVGDYDILQDKKGNVGAVSIDSQYPIAMLVNQHGFPHQYEEYEGLCSLRKLKPMKKEDWDCCIAIAQLCGAYPFKQEDEELD